MLEICEIYSLLQEMERVCLTCGDWGIEGTKCQTKCQKCHQSCFGKYAGTINDTVGKRSFKCHCQRMEKSLCDISYERVPHENHANPDKHYKNIKIQLEMDKNPNKVGNLTSSQ